MTDQEMSEITECKGLIINERVQAIKTCAKDLHVLTKKFHNESMVLTQKVTDLFGTELIELTPEECESLSKDDEFLADNEAIKDIFEKLGTR